MIRLPGKAAAATLALICSAHAASAQLPTLPDICWTPRPLAGCKIWAITEVALEMPLSSTSHVQTMMYDRTRIVPDLTTRRVLTLGAMANLGPSTAAGISFSSTSDEPRARNEVRIRQWLTSEIGLDLSAGYAASTAKDQDGDFADGMTASLGIADRYLGFDTRVDLLRAPDGRPVRATYVSIRAGSRAAPIVVGVGAVAYVALRMYGYKGAT